MARPIPVVYPGLEKRSGGGGSGGKEIHTKKKVL